MFHYNPDLLLVLGQHDFIEAKEWGFAIHIFTSRGAARCRAVPRAAARLIVDPSRDKYILLRSYRARYVYLNRIYSD